LREDEKEDERKENIEKREKRDVPIERLVASLIMNARILRFSLTPTHPRLLPVDDEWHIRKEPTMSI
jgi:hypothetical protein